MQLDINVVIQIYKEEIGRLQNENLLLKAQILQMNKEKNAEDKSCHPSCDEGK